MDVMKGYRIPKLKGAQNYDTWVIEITSVLKLEGLWKITARKTSEPMEPVRPQAVQATNSTTVVWLI